MSRTASPAVRPVPPGRTGPDERERTGDHGLSLLLFALAGGLVVNTVLGPLGAGVVDYSLSESLHNQLVGLEVITVVLVAPLCALAGALLRRGRRAGAVLALGPAAYTAYMLVQYLVGPGYEHYPPVLVFHLGLFVLSGVVVARAWSAFGSTDLPPMTPRARRARSWVLLGLGAFVTSRYLPALVGSVGEEALSQEFAAEPAFFWTILLMDLGIVVPLTVAASMGLRRATAAADKWLYAIVGWFALVPPSVAAMAVVMVVNDDPYASTASMAVFVTAAVAFGAFALHVFRPLLTGPRATTRSA
jgi:hypothetical protein